MLITLARLKLDYLVSNLVLYTFDILFTWIRTRYFDKTWKYILNKTLFPPFVLQESLSVDVFNRDKIVFALVVATRFRYERILRMSPRSNVVKSLTEHTRTVVLTIEFSIESRTGIQFRTAAGELLSKLIAANYRCAFHARLYVGRASHGPRRCNGAATVLRVNSWESLDNGCVSSSFSSLSLSSWHFRTDPESIGLPPVWTASTAWSGLAKIEHVHFENGVRERRTLRAHKFPHAIFRTSLCYRKYMFTHVTLVINCGTSS